LTCTCVFIHSKPEPLPYSFILHSNLLKRLNFSWKFLLLSSYPVSRKTNWKGDEERKAKRDRLSTLDYLEISIWFKCPKLQPMRMRPKHSRIQALEFNKYRLIICHLNLNSICCLDKPNLHKKGSIWKYSKHLNSKKFWILEFPN